jgi:hypothetical protein
MHSTFQLHVIHVAGSYMILQRTYVLSREEYVTGVMTGTFAFLYSLPFTGSGQIVNFITLALILVSSSQSPTSLSTAKWFELGQGLQGGAHSTEQVWVPCETPQWAFLWALAPAAAYAAVDALALS